MSSLSVLIDQQPSTVLRCFDKLSTQDEVESAPDPALFTRDRQTTFLAALASCGLVRSAAAGAGVSHRTAYRARLASLGFRWAWDAALLAARAQAEAEEVLAHLARLTSRCCVWGLCPSTMQGHGPAGACAPSSSPPEGRISACCCRALSAARGRGVGRGVLRRSRRAVCRSSFRQRRGSLARPS